MATLHDEGADRPRTIYVKGAVEAVLPLCVSALGPGPPGALDAGEVHRETEAMAALGLRVLAFARADAAPDRSSLGHEDLAGLFSSASRG